MNTKSKSMKVSAALDHADYTFQSFTAADWREMAKECLDQAAKRTCIDCGCDVELSSKRPHKLAGDRWACDPVTLGIKARMPRKADRRDGDRRASKRRVDDKRKAALRSRGAAP